jgi:hypothetical protein
MTTTSRTMISALMTSPNPFFPDSTTGEIGNRMSRVLKERRSGRAERAYPFQ